MTTKNSKNTRPAPEFVKGQVSAYCEMVQRGKPSAILPIQNRYVDELQRYIKSEYRLHVYTETLTEEWTTIWIYKDSHMLEVIQSLPQKTETVFDHWVLGKMFGYSDEAIRQYLESQTSSNSV